MSKLDHSSSPTPAAPFPEKEWVEKIRAGDKSAFEALFVAYYLKLRRFVKRYVPSNDIAEEIVQDLLVDFWEHRESWVVKESLRSYLYAAARNRAINFLRRNKLEAKWEDEELALLVHTDLDPHEEAARQELVAAVQQAIETLPGRCKLILTLSRKDGLTYAEIARVLGISIKTVETQMGRAFKMLRDRLSDYLPLLSAILFHCHSRMF